MATVIELGHLDTPIGRLGLAAVGGRLGAADFDEHFERALVALERRHPGASHRRVADPAGTASALAAYFAGDLGAVERIAVEWPGTAFARRVWAALREVPAGTTTTYGALARGIGAPRSARAVGAAAGANPVMVVVPCHRIVPAAGGTGAYRAGPDRKAWLLGHEAAHHLATTPGALTTATVRSRGTRRSPGR